MYRFQGLRLRRTLLQADVKVGGRSGRATVKCCFLGLCGLVSRCSASSLCSNMNVNATIFGFRNQVPCRLMHLDPQGTLNICPLPELRLSVTGSNSPVDTDTPFPNAMHNPISPELCKPVKPYP